MAGTSRCGGKSRGWGWGIHRPGTGQRCWEGQAEKKKQVQYPTQGLVSNPPVSHHPSPSSPTRASRLQSSVWMRKSGGTVNWMRKSGGPVVGGWEAPKHLEKHLRSL
jgi:hypothetical protein